jgi:diketogulonate reductase-like aldo/keto reductase
VAYGICRGYSVIYKTSTTERLVENAKGSEIVLEQADMDELLA